MTRIIIRLRQPELQHLVQHQATMMQYNQAPPYYMVYVFNNVGVINIDVTSFLLHIKRYLLERKSLFSSTALIKMFVLSINFTFRLFHVDITGHPIWIATKSQPDRNQIATNRGSIPGLRLFIQQSWFKFEYFGFILSSRRDNASARRLSH